MRSIVLAGMHYRITAMYEVQYRVNFFIQVFHTVLQAATGLIAIALVFRHTPELGGWDQSELLAIMGVHMMVGGVIAAFVQPAMRELMFQVMEGEFDFVLVKPADPQLMVSIRKISIWHLTDVAVGVGIVVWAVVRSGTAVDAGDVVAFLLLVAAGVTIMYSLWLALTATSFKLVRVDEMTQLIDGLYQTGRWPVGIYPGWLRGILTFIIPLAFAVTVPAEAVTNRLSTITLLAAGAAGFLAFAAARWLFLHQIKSYSGASA